jgi:pyruvate/2-oxoglutarate dehydrogenase complex dihydrolipoamide acyltransferase (E2) component
MAVTSSEEDGRYEVVEPAFDRRLAMDVFDALPPSHPMFALAELDVTVPLARIEDLRAAGTRVSLFAFLVRCVAVAISEHPDMNTMRHGRRLIRFEDVDVNVPVEVRTPGGRFPRQVVLRRAQDRTAQELYAEIDAARRHHDRTGNVRDEDGWPRPLLRMLKWTPRPLRLALMRRIMRSAFLVKRKTGTTSVTSVGKFASVSGFVFPFSTGPRATLFAVGGVVEKPWLHGGSVEQRSVLPITILINHDLADGAPAARFGIRLKGMIESGEGL